MQSSARVRLKGYSIASYLSLHVAQHSRLLKKWWLVFLFLIFSATEEDMTDNVDAVMGVCTPGYPPSLPLGIFVLVAQ